MEEPNEMRIMLIEFIYPVVAFVLVLVSVLLSIGMWFWWKHQFWSVVNWLDRVSDDGMYWIIDRIMGCKGEMIKPEED